MPYVLDHLSGVSAALAGGPLALFTDLDGTLAEVVPEALEARVRPRLQRLLADLVARLPLVAVVSGRTVAQARAMVGVDGAVYVGNHGLEHWEGSRIHVHPGAADYAATVRQALEEIRQRIAVPGLSFEEKGLTASIHYRSAPDHPRAEELLRVALDQSPAVRSLHIAWGRLVVEIRPPLAVDKGTACVALLRERGLSRALFLGDDTTDLDAFRALRALAREESDFMALGLGVLSDETPPAMAEEADYLFRGIYEVEIFLEWLTRGAPG